MKSQPSISDHLGNKGPKPTIHWQDADWTVSYITPNILATIEQQIAKNAIEEAKVVPQIEPEVIRMIATRGHRALGPLWNLTFSTPYGDVFILWACVRDNHKGFTLEDAEKMYRESRVEVLATLEMIRPDFWDVLSAKTMWKAEEIDPQRRAARKPTTSTPCTGSSSSEAQESVASPSPD